MADIIRFPDKDEITRREFDILAKGDSEEATLFQAYSLLRGAYTVLRRHFTDEQARIYLEGHARSVSFLRQGESVELKAAEGEEA